jgi:hypothetical protein
MCSFCAEWKKRSPKTYVRFNSKNPDAHTVEVVAYAFGIVAVIKDRFSREQCRQEFNIRIEGDDLPVLTKADHKLVQEIINHEINAFAEGDDNVVLH